MMSEAPVDYYFQRLPSEILVPIVKLVQAKRGKCFMLNVLSKVSDYWYTVVYDSAYWITLDQNDLRYKHFIALAKNSSLEKTKVLNLCFVSKDLTEEDLLLILSESPVLVNFKIFRCSFGAKVLQYLNVYCPVVGSLELRKCSNYSSPMESIMFADFLQSNGAILTKIDLWKTPINDSLALLTLISETCPNLIELKMTHCPRKKDIFPITAFQLYCPKLKVLQLSGFHFNVDETVETEGFKHLVNLRSSYKLVFTGSLALMDEFMYALGDYELSHLLKNSPGLKYLNVSGSNVTVQGLVQLPINGLEELDVASTKALSLPNFNDIYTRWKTTLKHVNRE